MKKLVLLIFMAVIFIFSNAQKDKYQGYMGKKFIIKYLGRTGVELGGKKIFKINFSHGPEIEYILSKKFSLIVSTDFQSSSKPIATKSIAYYDNYDPNKKYKNSTKNTLVVLKLKKYFQGRGSFAPYGTYLAVHFGMISSKFNYYVKNYLGSHNDVVSPKSAKSINPILGLSFGRQFIFAKRMVVDAGIITSAPIPLKGFLNNIGFDEAVGSPPIEDFMLSQLLRAYVAIGFMAF